MNLTSIFFLVADFDVFGVIVTSWGSEMTGRFNNGLDILSGHRPDPRQPAFAFRLARPRALAL